MQEAIVWKPAIYARLSNDDGRDGVSLSIENQVEIMQKFVKEQGWQTPKVFYDDDKTGTNFNRAGFQDMYNEAKRKTINVIIMKDTSRFGRNWIQSGMYFDQIEQMNVRFISLQEGIDTIDPKCPGLKMLPFHFVFNEWHSSTTSEKIRAVLKKDAEQGKHTGRVLPYGYEKDPNDKHKLIIDPDAAEVVKKIFDLKLAKYSFYAIADILIMEKIPSPSLYYSMKYGENKRKVSREGYWNANSVKNVIHNPVYAGDIVNFRTSTISYKNRKRVFLPEEQQIVSADMHNPIVSREVWQKCNEINNTNVQFRRNKDNQIYPFSGLLVCQDCGERLIHSRGFRENTSKTVVYERYNCPTYKAYGKLVCQSHYIRTNVVMDLVCRDIRRHAKNIILNEEEYRKKLQEFKIKSNKTEHNTNMAELAKAQSRIAELNKLLKEAFERSVLGNLHSSIFDDFVKGYEEEKSDLTIKAEQLSTAINRQEQIEIDADVFISLIKKYVDVTELDRATAVQLIDHIEISAYSASPRAIEIYYNYAGKF